MHVVIFEGAHWTHLTPLTLSRPVFMLTSGAGTLLDKQLHFLQPTRVTFWVRPGMIEYTRKHVLPLLDVPAAINEPLDDEPAQLISGRTLHFTRFEYPNEEAIVLDEGDVIRSAFVRRPGLSYDDAMNRTDKWLSLLKLPHVMPQSRMVDYPWDLVSWNEESLVEDSLRVGESPYEPQPGPYWLVTEENIYFSEGVRLHPGAVLDASSGPIILGEGVSIGANAVIQGPCYIGNYTQIQPLTYLRPGTSIGAHCKIGGELSNCIVQNYVNKIHYGFFGDSYVGDWVNLGAGTTTSNLKNTYDEVTMQIAGKTFNTGRRFMGAIIGDHTKTAIGTRLMTGSYIGYCCSLASSTIPPRYVPSFSFITDKGIEPFRMDKAIQVMQAVYGRRSKEWTTADSEMAKTAAAFAIQCENN